MQISDGSTVHTETIDFLVGNIGLHKVILGTPWLIKHNPVMDWQKYTIEMTRCTTDCYDTKEHLCVIAKGRPKLRGRTIDACISAQDKNTIKWLEEEEEIKLEEGDTMDSINLAQAIFHSKSTKQETHLQPIVNQCTQVPTKRQIQQTAKDKCADPLTWSKTCWEHFYNQIRAQNTTQGQVPKASNTSQQLAQKNLKNNPIKLSRDIVPHIYHKFLKMFDKKEANRFPSSKLWDHAIKLKETFVPKDCCIYPLSPVEQH